MFGPIDQSIEPSSLSSSGPAPLSAILYIRSEKEAEMLVRLVRTALDALCFLTRVYSILCGIY